MTDADKKPEDQSEISDVELSRRLNKLDAKLGAERKVRVEKKRKEEAPPPQGLAQAFRLSTEFVAGVVVGGGIGYGIDWLAGTAPWGMILFLLLGFAAAVLNVMRSAGLVAESNMRLVRDDVEQSPASKPPEKDK
ncbi:MAG: AtpZ/AtpI family protein [Pseudomonadota bacterium]